MYSQEITRTHRSAFVLVLDRSASMQQQVRFGELLMSKAEAVAYTANLKSLTLSQFSIGIV